VGDRKGIVRVDDLGRVTYRKGEKRVPAEKEPWGHSQYVWEPHHMLTHWRRAGYGNQLKAFARAILDKTPTYPSLHDGWRNLVVARAILESCASRSVVEVPQIEEGSRRNYVQSTQPRRHRRVRRELHSIVDAARSAASRASSSARTRSPGIIEKDGVEGRESLFAEAESSPLAGASRGLERPRRESGARAWKSCRAWPRPLLHRCPRTMTWIMPCSDELPFERKLSLPRRALHAHRGDLADAGLQSGPGVHRPQRRCATRRSIPSSTPCRDAGDGRQIGPNVGCCSTAGTGIPRTHGADLRALRPEQVVYVHVNDAPEASHR
jgi:hypothetical protein